VNLENILRKYRDQIIEEWIERLHSGSSERYRERPLDELRITVAGAYDASHAVLIHNDFSKIGCHIEWITKARLEGGFSLSEVQNAYELYRVLLLPALTKELKGPSLSKAIEQLNTCLFYTIRRYSNYFQSLHEREIKDHALKLEHQVANRTRELTESEAKYRVLVEEINDGYFVTQDGNIVFANKAFCNIHGYKPGEVVGRSLRWTPLSRQFFTFFKLQPCMCLCTFFIVSSCRYSTTRPGLCIQESGEVSRYCKEQNRCRSLAVRPVRSDSH